MSDGVMVLRDFAETLSKLDGSLIRISVVFKKEFKIRIDSATSTQMFKISTYTGPNTSLQTAFYTMQMRGRLDKGEFMKEIIDLYFKLSSAFSN